MGSVSTAGVADIPAGLFAGAMPKGIGAMEFLEVYISGQLRSLSMAAILARSICNDLN